MKRKLVLMLLITLVTFVLAGCDFFGGTTTTTDTTATSSQTTSSATSTTTTTTTTGTATVTTTITTTTTSSGQTTTTTTTTSTGATTTTSTSTTTTTSTGTTTTTSQPTTTTTSDGSFDRQDLIDYFISRAGETPPTSEQIEAEIDFYLNLLGTSSEEDLYNLLIGADTLMTGFDALATLQDIQALYNQAISLGFDRQTVINLMINAFKQMLNQQLNDIDLTEYPADIADLEADLSQETADRASLISSVAAYCIDDTEYAAQCQSLFDLAVSRYEARVAYQDLLNQTMWNSENFYWDWNLFNDLLFNLDNLVRYTYYDVSVEMASEAQVNIINLLDFLSTDELSKYNPILDAYEAYLIIHYRDYSTLQDTMSSYTDDYSSYIVQIMDQNVFQYEQYSDNIADDTREIANRVEWQADRVSEHALLTAIVAYFATASGTTKLTNLAGMLYDILGNVVLNFNQDTFDFILGLLSKQIILGPDMLTSENIANYPAMFSDVLALIRNTITTEDIDNIKSLAKDIIPIVLAQAPIDPLELPALLAKVNTTVDQYVDMIFTAIDTVIIFTGNINQTKADAIYAFVIDMMNMGMSESEMVIRISELVNLLTSDGSLNLDFIANSMIEVYFDVQYQLSPDETTVGLVKTAFMDNLDRILELANLIKDYDPMSLNAEQLILMDEMKSRVDAIGMAFKVGFESILDPISWEYDHEDFLALVQDLFGYYMTTEEAEGQIQMLMDFFSMTSEEDTYYLVKSIVNFGIQIKTIQSFTEFQNWIAAVSTLGFSNSEIAGYVFDFLTIKLDQDINNNNELQFYLDQIADYEASMLLLQIDLDNITALISAQIALLSPELRQAAWDYWYAKVELFNLQRAVDETFNECTWVIDYWTVMGLHDSWTNYLTYLNDSMPEQATEMYNNFYALFNELNTEQQSYVDAMRDAIEDYVNQDSVLKTLMVTMMGNPAYMPFMSLVNMQLSNYVNTLYNIYDYQWWIASLQEDIDRINAQIALYENYLLYMDDADNQLLIEEVITILINEVQHVVASADPATFDILFQLLTGSMKPRVFMTEEPYDPFADIDLSALAILGYAEDLSTVLNALFDLMTPENVLKIKTLAFDLISIQLANEGKTVEEVAAQIALFDDAFAKYWPMLQETVGILSNTLDSLTEAKVQLFIDAIPLLSGSTENFAEIIITVSALIDSLVGEEALDIQTLIASYLVLYFDVTSEYNPNLTDLADVQALFAGYITELLLLAAEIKDYDLSTLTEAQMATLYEAQNLGKYLVECLMDPESIQADMTFTYVHQDFVDLVDMLFGFEGDVPQIESQIAMFITLFNTTEEDAFYKVLLYGQMILSARNIESVEDAQAWILSILHSPLSKEQLAGYIVDALIMAYDQAMSGYSPLDEIADLEIDLQDAEDDLIAIQADLAQFEADMTAGILTVLDPTANALLTQAWNEAHNLLIYQNQYWNVFNEGQQSWSWDYHTYELLFAYRYGGFGNDPDIDAYNSMWESLYFEEQVLYGPALNAYQAVYDSETNFYNYVSQLNALAMLSPDGENYLDIYILNARDTLFNYQGMINNAEYRVGDVTWMLADAQNRARMLLAFGAFIADANNVILAKASLTMILDEIENLAINIDPEVINTLIGFTQSGGDLSGLTTAELLTFVHNISSISGLLFDTIDAADEAILQEMISTFLYEYINAFDDSEQQAIALTGIFEAYFSDALALIPTLSTFLDNMTEARLQTILDQIATLDSVGGMDDLLSNYIRAVAIANLIEAVAVDPTINPDDLIASIFGAFFDVQYAMGVIDDGSTTAIHVTELQTIVGNVIGQAGVIIGYDPYLVTQAEIDQIIIFKDFIEQLGAYFDDAPVE